MPPGTALAVVRDVVSLLEEHNIHTGAAAMTETLLGL